MSAAASRRFDSQKYLEAFRARRAYPAIHDELFDLIAAEYRGNGAAIDVCCSTGLLGDRLKRKLGIDAIGWDADADAVERGQAAGVSIEVTVGRLDESTLAQFLELLSARGVRVLVARRCISELFTRNTENARKATLNPEFAQAFVDGIAETGVNQVFLQGRAESRASVHPIPNVDAEAGFFARRYERVISRGQLCYMRLRSDV